MKNPPTRTSFFKQHILPALLVFLVPGFSVWFFGYAERDTDKEILSSIERQIDGERNTTDAQKQEARAFWRNAPVSNIMASKKPEAAELQAMFEPAKDRYAIFRWMKWTALVCLAAVGATFVLVGVSVAFSFRSQAAQYWSLRIGWPILRTSALIQVVGQATLAVFLSYWVTAVFTQSYYIKLVAVIGLLAGLAVFALAVAIFKKVDPKCEVSGRILSETDAPALWQRIREMAAKLRTTPPDRVIVGITPSFFVTEHAVDLDGARHAGRTLFLSLPMLKIMSVEEADAIFGHELAHFSGQDTLWSRKISPLLGKFALYLQLLGTGLTIVVSSFMHVFWKLYMLSIGRLSREREFRADGIGAGLTSSQAMQRALIKVSGYCEYRAKTENAMIEQNRLNPELRLAARLEDGYGDFLKAFTSDAKAAYSETPHPFDSHPPLEQRLQSLGANAADALKEQYLHAPLAQTWHDTMPTAPAMEQEMWAEREAFIQSYHSQDLAWRLLPTCPEEVDLVVAHFPQKEFTSKKGETATLNYESIRLSSWPAAIRFGAIENAVMDSSWGRKKLKLTYRPETGGKSVDVAFSPEHFTNAEGAFLPVFERYFSRHKTAVSRSATRQS